MECSATINILQALENADKAATLFINSLNCPLSDSFWAFISLTKIWFPFYIIVAFFLFLRLNWKKATIVLVSCILTVVACDQLGNISKDFFERLRPCWDNDMLRRGLVFLEGRWGGDKFGFYSAHAANTMGFAVVSYLGFRNDKSRNYKCYLRVVLVWALLVGISRIFVGKHFLGDVLAGMFVGLFFGWLLGTLASKLITCLSRH